MEHLISVIVCTYNQEETIARTLDSILMQQCHVPYEIVIGEDCSKDQTLNVCQAYKRKHPDIIRIIANEENKGLVENYFNCIQACRGEFIADCAGDDFWTDPLKLEKEVCILESRPDVTLVHTNWASFCEATNKSYPNTQETFPDSFTSGQRMLEAIITQRKTPIIQLCTSLYRSSIILEALQDDKESYINNDFGCEDLQIAFLMASKGNIAYIPEVTLNYSQGKVSISNPESHIKRFLFTRRISSLSFYLATRNNINTEHSRKYFSWRIYELGMHAFRAHNEQLFQETIQCEHNWNAYRKTRTKILFFTMRHHRLWSWGLTIRGVFVILKQLCH